LFLAVILLVATMFLRIYIVAPLVTARPDLIADKTGDQISKGILTTTYRGHACNYPPVSA